MEDEVFVCPVDAGALGHIYPAHTDSLFRLSPDDEAKPRNVSIKRGKYVKNATPNGWHLDRLAVRLTSALPWR